MDVTSEKKNVRTFINLRKSLLVLFVVRIVLSYNHPKFSSFSYTWITPSKMNHLVRFFLVVSMAILAGYGVNCLSAVTTGGTRNVCTITVCQNKDCCKRWKGTSATLPETLFDLLVVGDDSSSSSFEITTTSCLSQCQKGPNIRLSVVGTKERMLYGITDATTAAIEIETAFPDFTISSKLLAAVTCMDKATRATSYEEKERFLSSVIRALDNDEQLKYSTANARAKILRCDANIETGRDELLDTVLLDAQEAIIIIQKQMDIVTGISNDISSLEGRALRLQSDVYVRKKQYQNAINCLRDACRANPIMQSKYITDIGRIQKIIEKQK